MKKVFVIFSIVLILFSFTVPCFAVRDSLNFYITNDDVVSPSLHCWFPYNFGAVLSFNDSNLVISGGSSGFGPACNVDLDHIYYYYFDVFNSSSSSLYVDVYCLRSTNTWSSLSSTEIISPGSSFVFSGYVTRSISALGIRSYNSNSASVIIQPYIFDLTKSGYTSENYTDFEQDFLNSGGSFTDSYLFGFNYIANTSFKDPFFNFYRNLGHTFDFVPVLFTEYTQISIFIISILSICFVIFIVVFMFKKFVR